MRGRTEENPKSLSLASRREDEGAFPCKGIACPNLKVGLPGKEVTGTGLGPFGESGQFGYFFRNPDLV